MARLSEWLIRAGSILGSISRVYWILLSITLTIPYLLAREVEPETYLVFKQLGALYLIDSLLFFFVERSHAKMGSLTLIFLIAMEAFVIIYYGISIYSGHTG